MKTKNRLLVKSCIDEITPRIEVLSQLFYKELFHLDSSLRGVFYGNVMFLNKKFINLLATLKNVKHLEAINSSLVRMGERHAANYGAEIKHFPVLKQALLLALHQHLGERFNAELEAAWHDVFDDVSTIMMQAMSNIEVSQSTVINEDHSNYDASLFDEIGSEDIILRVHQRFYDAIFEEPWLEKFFYGKEKETLIRKQTQFMVAAFNGPNNYMGDTPAFVHMHMLITEEMSNVRETLLKRAILAEGLSTSIAERWLAVDRSFRPAIVKKSVDECVLKCVGQMPIVAEKPLNYVAP